jgi:acetyl-CoA C-acetyltransferase
VNDGASALLLVEATRAASLGIAPIAKIIAQATSGLAPKLVLMTPVESVRRVVEKAGWTIDEVDLFELNEAFSVQAVAVLNELGVDERKVNVNGGAVALGHAIGSSGSRILTTLLYALQQRGLKRGVATLCLGGGNGVALAIERP